MDMRDRIKALLIEKKVGKKAAALAIGRSERWLGQYLDGDTQQMGHESLAKLAELLGVSADYILFGGDDRGEDPKVRKVVSIFEAMPDSDKPIALRVLEGMAKTKEAG